MCRGLPGVAARAQRRGDHRPQDLVAAGVLSFRGPAPPDPGQPGGGPARAPACLAPAAVVPGQGRHRPPARRHGSLPTTPDTGPAARALRGAVRRGAARVEACNLDLDDVERRRARAPASRFARARAARIASCRSARGARGARRLRGAGRVSRRARGRRRERRRALPERARRAAHPRVARLMLARRERRRPRRRRRTRSATRSRPTCSTTAPTCARSRSCSATRACDDAALHPRQPRPPHEGVRQRPPARTAVSN